MSPEHDTSQGQDGTEHFTVTQRFDLTRMIESEAVEVDLPTALSELIDNSLDQTIKGKPCEVVVTLDARSGRLYFENKNTAGMDNTDFQSFMTWGLRHKEGRTYSEHGQGGKLAIVQLLDKSRGNLNIISQAGGSKTYRRMEITNWWQKLDQGLPFDVKTGTTDTSPEKGFTRIELEGLKQNAIPGNLAVVADEIGHIYAPLIKEGKLSIILRRLSKAGGPVAQLNVLPAEVLFSRQQFFERKGVPAKRGAIKFDISWGMTDQSLREKDKNARSSAYGVPPSSISEPEPEYIYLYNRGRRHDKIPVSALKIFRLGSKKITFATFAIVLNVTEGTIPRTLLKKGLSPTSPEKTIILERVREIVTPFVQEHLKGRDETISTADKTRAKVASSKFGAVLLGLFNNSQTDIFKEFFSSPALDIKPSGGEKTTKKPQDASAPLGLINRKLKLPGTSEGHAGSKNKFNVRRITNPIPELAVATYNGRITPVAELSRDVDASGRTKLVVSLNFDNPQVKLALQGRSELGIVQLLIIGAQALYHEKWIANSPKDSAVYKEGIDEDVAKFITKAEELRII